MKHTALKRLRIRQDSRGRKPEKNLRAKSSMLVSVAITSVVMASGPAYAQFVDDSLYDGGKARVNLSASLRAQTERVAAASCRLAAGIDTAVAEEDLARGRDRITRILAGLKNGDTTLGIPNAETRGRSLQSIGKVLEKWQPANNAAGNMINGQVDGSQLAAITDSYRDLHEEAVVLAAEISGQYSNPMELLRKDAVTIDFMSRQHTLLDRMARITCGLATNNAALGSVDELNETVDLFERTLIALRDGFPDAGISVPPNDAVKNTLVQAFEEWTEKKPIFDGILAGNPVTEQDVIEVVNFDKELTVAMTNAITLYLISSPGQQGVYKVPLSAYAENELSKWLTDPALLAAIRSQNERHSDLTEDQIIALDQTWRAEADAGGGPLISEVLGRDVSRWLAAQQAATAGFVTEVFVMDNRGLNVAQNIETSDYWQGDEAKWKETFAREDGGLHISDVEFDDSTGFYQTQASMPIFDPTTNQKIGAVTFGINVQSLM